VTAEPEESPGVHRSIPFATLSKPERFVPRPRQMTIGQTLAGSADCVPEAGAAVADHGPAGDQYFTLQP
jgi:hypothetical protein